MRNNSQGLRSVHHSLDGWRNDSNGFGRSGMHLVGVRRSVSRGENPYEQDIGHMAVKLRQVALMKCAGLAINVGIKAVETAAGSLRDLRVAEVTKMDMKVDKGKVTPFRTRVALSFKYETE